MYNLSIIWKSPSTVTVNGTGWLCGSELLHQPRNLASVIFCIQILLARYFLVNTKEKNKGKKNFFPVSLSIPTHFCITSIPRADTIHYVDPLAMGRWSKRFSLCNLRKAQSLNCLKLLKGRKKAKALIVTS